MKATYIVLSVMLMQLPVQMAAAQKKGQIVRLAKLVIDSAYLDSYKEMLKEGIETSLREEPGVLTLYALYEKENPTHFTILETYASPEAYEAHLKTPHFQKYKTGTLHMVRSLELIETVPLLPELKVRQIRKHNKRNKP
jgi:4-carboxymuconolactone decarboxylase